MIRFCPNKDIFTLQGQIMRGIFIIVLLTFSFSSLCQAQRVIEIDKRLKGLYKTSQLKQLKESNPQFLARLNYYLDNAFIITEQNEEKPTDFLGDVVIDDLENFNILKLEKDQNLKRSWDKISVYRIKGTNQLLVYHAGRNFNRDFQKHYRETQK